MNLTLNASGDEIIKKFSSLSTTRNIADLLEIEYKTLVYLVYRRDPDSNYKTFILQKKSGGTRVICSPISSIKILQSKLCYILSLIYKPRESVHGFVQGRSIVTNARPHVKKQLLYSADLLDFFPSINFGRVRGMFISYFNIPPEVGTVLAQICCYNNQLPQGSPTSPIISNLICSKMDRQLQELAKSYGCTYTRYADDITFSFTRKKLPSQFENEVSNVILNSGFRINIKKVRVRSKFKRLEVTGLTVNNFPNVQRKFVRQVRAMLNAWQKYGLERAEEYYISTQVNINSSPFKCRVRFENVVRGKINYIRMVRGSNDPIYQKLAIRYNILSGTKAFPNYFQPRKNLIFVR